MSRDEPATAVVAAATAGDQAAFTALAERYRRELQLHCYRMLGSYEDAEDLVQETFLRAWQRRATFEQRSSFRAWLYRIATNACLDVLRSRARRVQAQHSPQAPAAELPWLQPYPDHLLEGTAAGEDEPEAAVVARETIELAFIAAIQYLPPRQRAVLIARDVLGWSAKETASLLEASVASVNSALQRARPALEQHLPRRRLDWSAPPERSEEEHALLQRYMDAHERGDVAAVAALLREDALFSMPPQPSSYSGREAIEALFFQGIDTSSPEWVGHFRLVPTRANGQLAAANYVRRTGDSEYRGLALDVLRIEDGQIVEIVAFEPHLFRAFGLPETLPAR